MAYLSSVHTSGPPIVEARPANNAVVANIGGGLLSLPVDEAEQFSADLMAAVEQVRASLANVGAA